MESEYIIPEIRLYEIAGEALISIAEIMRCYEEQRGICDG